MKTFVPPPRKRKLLADNAGKLIPPNCEALWKRRNETTVHIMNLNRIRKSLEESMESEDKLYAGSDLKDIVNRLKRIESDLKAARPYAVCSCKGLGCALCKKTGLLGKFVYELCIPEGMK